jgi:hypothetical protein
MEKIMKSEDNRNAEADRDGGKDEASSETEEYEHIAALLQGISTFSKGDGPPWNAAARLALLEENFARICTIVGKLEQEVLELKGKKPDEPL